MKKSIFLISAHFVCLPTLGVEFKQVVTQVIIPSDASIALEGDTRVSVDRLQVEGSIYSEGYLLRMDVGQIQVERGGLIGGYSLGNVPNPPPKREGFSSEAAEGASVPPPQSALDMFTGINRSAKQGATGNDGQKGEIGVPGNLKPGPIVLVAGSLVVKGAIFVKGQHGGSGGPGQDGQNGGRGGAAQDAGCDSGNVSVSCYSGVIQSGLGGLGGRGGPGGDGGNGGQAVPLLMISYLNKEVYPLETAAIKTDLPKKAVWLQKCLDKDMSKPQPELKIAIENLNSYPGEQGFPGPPGIQAPVGDAGRAGTPCSAKAKWGSFFGSCAVPGGRRNNGNPVDMRPNVEQCGTVGKQGDSAKWTDFRTFLNVPESHFQPSTVSIHTDGSDHFNRLKRYAISIELVGRLAVTTRDALAEFRSLKMQKEQDEYARVVSIQFEETAKAISEYTGLKDISSLLYGANSTEFAAKAHLALSTLRADFTELKNNLLNTCQALHSQATRAGMSNPAMFMEKAFASCVASNMTWLPFERGSISVDIRSGQAIVPSQFIPFYTETDSEKKPLPVYVRKNFVTHRIRSSNNPQNENSVLRRPDAAPQEIASLSLKRKSTSTLQEFVELRQETAELPDIKLEAVKSR